MELIHTYKFSISKYKVVSLSLWILLFNLSCACNKHKDTDAASNKDSHTSKTLVVEVKEVDSNKSAENDLIIVVKPQEIDDDINQYFVKVTILEGQGRLLVANKKLNNKFKYGIDLDSEQCLIGLLPTKEGKEAKSKKRNQLKIRCKYKPGIGAKPGDKHRLVIVVSKKDSEGNIIQEEQSEISLTIKAAPKPLVVVKEVDVAKVSEHYLTIGVKSQELGDDINQYLVSAQVLEGQGSLLAAQEKDANKFQYKIPLQTEQCMGKLLPVKGDASMFKEGKEFKVKCKYEPGVGSKPGDKHRLLIKVNKRDSEGKIVQEAQAEISLTIKEPSKPLVVVKEVDVAKCSEHYLTIGIKSQEVEDDLNQYFVSAQVLEGQGKLLGANEKLNNKFCYQLSLQEAHCMSQLLPIGNSSMAGFKEGKLFKVRCKYEPGVEAKPGDKHRLLIKISKQGSAGKIVQEEKVAININIKKEQQPDREGYTF